MHTDLEMQEMKIQHESDLEKIEDACARLIEKVEQLKQRVAAQDESISKLRATIMRLTDESEGATEL